MITPAVLRTYFVEDNPTIRDNLIATLEERAGITMLGYAETEQQGSVWLAATAGAVEQSQLAPSTAARRLLALAGMEQA